LFEHGHIQAVVGPEWCDDSGKYALPGKRHVGIFCKRTKLKASRPPTGAGHFLRELCYQRAMNYSPEVIFAVSFFFIDFRIQI
jgi:hypothetical protein